MRSSCALHFLIACVHIALRVRLLAFKSGRLQTLSSPSSLIKRTSLSIPALCGYWFEYGRSAISCVICKESVRRDQCVGCANWSDNGSSEGNPLVAWHICGTSCDQCKKIDCQLNITLYLIYMFYELVNSLCRKMWIFSLILLLFLYGQHNKKNMYKKLESGFFL